MSNNMKQNISENAAPSKAPICCGVPVKGSKQPDGNFMCKCQKCGRTAEGKTPADAFAAWSVSKPASVQYIPPQPSSAGGLAEWAKSRLPALKETSARWLDSGKGHSAVSRMIKRNIQHAVNADFGEAWKTEDGRKSITDALEESFYYGATLPEMGSLVPFGGTVEFIPSVECFEFALKNGANAPFRSLSIEIIYENDIYRTSRKNGNFSIEFESIPAKRGESVGVVVYGEHIPTGRWVGEMYEVDRLMDKARAHSASYRKYINDLNEFNFKRSEGKTQIDEAGREFFFKQIKKKDGGTWDKKIFKDELSNPYDSSDLPEMLRKLAGKTFCRPYIKVRNAEAMSAEYEEGIADDSDLGSVVDAALAKASAQMQPETTRNPEPVPDNYVGAESVESEIPEELKV